MSQQNELNDPKKDNLLADFADRVMEGNAVQIASSPDEELVSLEKTVLRLNDAIPPASVDEASVKQMLVRLKARVRREEQAATPSFWKRLFDIQSNLQIGMILAAVAVLVLVFISVPALQPGGSAVSGTAFSGGNILIAGGLITVLVLVYFLSRRK